MTQRNRHGTRQSTYDWTTMPIERIVAAVALITLSGSAIAGSPILVPEPETLALLAVGATAAVVVRWLRKK
jgi:hypothetical protein